MCLIVFAYQAHPQYPLIVVANRDETYDRKASPLHRWNDEAGVIAGRDEKALGTWLGMTTTGRFAALTNVRNRSDMRPVSPDEPSRGHLVSNVLQNPVGAFESMKTIAKQGQNYRGYNLLGGDPTGLYYTSNRADTPDNVTRIGPGVHGLSNHLLNTPWPKVEKGKTELAALINGGLEVNIESLFNLMADRTVFPDESLPDTGVGITAERLLSPIFLEMPSYGTRCTTALLVSRSGDVTLAERTYVPGPVSQVMITSRVETASFGAPIVL